MHFYDCPLCDQSGIALRTIKETGEQVWICEECDSAWEPGDPIEMRTLVDLSDFMERRGLPPWWDQIQSPDDRF